ncbi:MAG: 4a-hydroxytetrahydrobiopterin dehydratase [Pseudomonadota bacterium]
MNTMLRKKDWSSLSRRALTATEIVTRLSAAPGWKLTGDGADVAIEKTYTFANYYETISFVNALAFIANAQDHHPDLSVHYNRCVVRFNTHDVKGLSESDFECALLVDGLLDLSA